MGFELKLDATVAQSAGAGGGIDTGVHKCKITGAYLGTTKGGNNTLDLELETITGAKTTVYGICIDEKWKSGAENYDYPKWQELAAVAQMKTGATVDCKRKDFNGVESDAVAFTELVGKTLVIAIQVENDVNDTNNQPTKKRKLYRTFFETGHSIAEKQASSEAKQSVTLGTNLKDYNTKAFKAHVPSAVNTEQEAPTEASEPDTDLI